MPKAIKQPNGKYRIRIYTHTDVNGKKKYASFTGNTKREVELEAAKFAASPDRVAPDDITVYEAVMRFIEAHEGSDEDSHSASTTAGYIKDLRALEPLHHMKIKKIKTHDLQMFIKEQKQKGLKPKTICNRYSLLKKALKYNHIDVTQFDVDLPKVKRYKGYAPSDSDVATLYNAANRKLKICIMLAAKHSLRRGEISALTYGDLEGNKLHVHADVVKDKNGKWIYKPWPKTEESNRTLYLSEDELKLIGKGFPNQPIVDIVPSSIGTEYYNLKKQLGLMDIRFHDFRVYFASAAYKAGMPELYTALLGGWKENSPVLRDHYRKPDKTMEDMYAMNLNKKLDQYLSGVQESV